MANPDKSIKIDKRYLIIFGVLIIGLYVILPQLGGFKNSLDYLRHPNYSYVAIAVLFALGTYVAGAITYILLAFTKLKFWLTVLVQLTAMFVNRLLPAGLGAVGVNYLYLRKRKHTEAQAASVITVNNFVGLLGHSILTLFVLVIAKVNHQSLMMAGSNLSSAPARVLLVAGLVLAVSVAIFGKDRVKKGLNDFLRQLSSYRHRPKSLLFALMSSMTLTLFNVMSLLFCLSALGVHLSFVQIFIVFSFGVGTGVAIPTPGGVGGFEAGLVGGFVAYHVASSQALAAAILYRIITYWGPLLLGGLAFLVTQKQLGLGKST